MKLDEYEYVRTVVLPNTLMSDRDTKLCITNEKWDFGMSPLLTVELYTKWYRLFLVSKHTDRSVNIHAVDYSPLEDVCPAGVSPFLDHAPNPLCVKLFTRRNGYEIDELALELITGRWQIEYVDDRVMECDRCEGKGFVYIMGDTVHCHRDVCRACKGFGELRPERKP